MIGSIIADVAQSTSFEAAANGGAEVFGAEGPILLGIGMLLIALTIIQLITGSGSQRASAATLDEIEATIAGKEGK